jgi:hypothetical protein
VAHVELPLLFVKADDPIYQRSLWRSLIDKSCNCQHLPAKTLLQQVHSTFDHGARVWSLAHIQWAADTIEHFVRQEKEKWATDLADAFAQDRRMHDEFAGEPNLMRRLLALSPRSPATP